MATHLGDKQFRGLRYKGKYINVLSTKELREAVTNLCNKNLELTRQIELQKLLTTERLFGIEGKLKDINFNKLMKELNL